MIVPIIKHADSNDYAQGKNVPNIDESIEDTNVPNIQNPIKSNDPNNTAIDTPPVSSTPEQKDFNPLVQQDAFDWNTYSNAENVLPDNVYKSLPTAEQVVNNEFPEDYEQVINEFFPYITDYNVFSAKYDISFDALYFLGLGGLGGQSVRWVLGRESLSEEDKKKRDYHTCNCDANNGKTFNIDDVLNHAISYASAHHFEPPAPIFGLAGHPNCTCALTFTKQENFASYQNIADNCPGIPVNCTPDVKQKYKEQIWNKIPDTLYINSRTFPPLFITAKTASTHHINTKIASANISKVAVEVNRPVEIVRNCIGFLSYGMWTPVPVGSVGFLLGVTGKKAIVYLSVYQHEISVPIDAVRVIEKLTESNLSIKDTHFVSCDGSIGLLCYRSGDKYFVYSPATRKVVPTDHIDPLGFSPQG